MRSAINAWGMGLPVPSTQCIAELAKYFNVSTDFLLGMRENTTISVTELTDEQISAVLNVIQCFRDN